MGYSHHICLTCTWMALVGTTLNTCQTGCYSSVSKVNHIMYADDLVLLSPCTVGLSRLLKCCDDYCITPIFRVEEIFAIFANWDFARNFPPAKIISTANGISRNFPPAKFTSREIFLPAKIKF